MCDVTEFIIAQRVKEQKKSIATAIKKQRKAKGLTQKEFSKQLGVSQPTISNIEQGRGEFGIDVLVRIAILLKMRLSTSMEPKKDEPDMQEEERQ